MPKAHLRRSQERGHFNFGWLDTYHSFSFGEYFDPAFMGFRDLRVINEDQVAAGKGFPTHSHRDMEIVTFIIEGELEHKDSLGTGSVIRPGEIQRMSAGTGIQHSEFNASTSKKVHLLQIWILPAQKGISPSYEQKTFDPKKAENSFLLLGSSKESTGSAVKIHQDVDLFYSKLSASQSLRYQGSESRHLWLQLIRGEVSSEFGNLKAGDGLGLSEVKNLEIRGASDSEFLLFDLN